MTILFFSRLFAPHIGGVEKHVYEISQILLKKGHKIVVITENHGWEKEQIIDNIQVYRVDGGLEGKNKKLRIWNELWKLRHIIKDADIVHCHDVFFWYLPFRYLYSEKPVYTTFHGYEGNDLPTTKAIIMHRLAEMFSLGTISIGAFLEKWYKTHSRYVTYGAVDKVLLQKKSVPKRDIIFIGRLEEEAGIMKYLQALQLLKKKQIFLTMDIYGNGSLEEKAKKIVKDNDLKVVFHGFDKDVSNYICNYQYVCTSRYLGILEGMAMQRPVFAEYNNAIKKDYLEMTPFASWISIAKNSGQIAVDIEAVMKVKRDLDVKKGYEWTQQQTWGNMVDIYERLWKLQTS